MRIPALSRIVLATALAGLLAACGAPTVPPVTIASIAAGDAQFSTLVAALTKAELVDTFADADAGPFTVFAPTNAGFTQFLADAGLTAEELLDSPNLGDILKYHVLDGEFLAADVIAAAPFAAQTLLAGESIDVAVVNDGVLLDCRVNVVTTDIVASNGVIHVVDYVLDPNAADLTIAEIAACNDAFSTLVAALTKAELVDTFADADAGPFTVFAPTNAAFTQFLTDEGLTAAQLLASPDLVDILQYHVVPGALSAADVIAAAPGTVPTLLTDRSLEVGVVGDTVILNCRVDVVMTDIVASNGVIHVVDYVLDPNAGNLTIAEGVTCYEDFSHLAAALEAAGLLETFADPKAGPFMVFAPTNDAIEQYLSLKEDFGLDDFLAQDPELIAAFLSYHVSLDIRDEADLLAVGGLVKSLLGPDIVIGEANDLVVLNPLSPFVAKVIQADIWAANGLIHVIDMAIEAP